MKGHGSSCSTQTDSPVDFPDPPLHPEPTLEDAEQDPRNDCSSQTDSPVDFTDPPLHPKQALLHTLEGAEQDLHEPRNGLLDVILVIVFTLVFMYTRAFKRVDQPLNWLSSSFPKYLVLGLATLAILGSLRGSPHLSNLSSSHLDVYRAPEVPAAGIVKLAERLRRMESDVSSLSAGSTCGRERLNAIEKRISQMKKALLALETDAKAPHLAEKKTFSTPTAPAPVSAWLIDK